MGNSDLKVKKGTFKGITLKLGKKEPLLDFPAVRPVEVWGMRLWNYDPETKNINLSINDVKAQADYNDTNEANKTSKTVKVDIDSTIGHQPGENEKPAFEINYDKTDESVITKVNIASASIPSLDIQSPTLSVSSLATVPNAVELKDIQADVKILLEKKATSGGEGRPMSFEINRLHVGEINAQGITVVRLDELGAENDDAKAKPVKKTMQVVTLPKNDKVSIKDINVSGLRVTLAEEGPALSTIGADASISVGQTDLSGIGYSEKTAKGSVLKAFSLDRGKFEELKLQALGRNGRQYSMDEFFKFFGSTQLAGLDAAASFKEGKTSGKIEVKGQKNRPISALYNVEKMAIRIITPFVCR